MSCRHWLPYFVWCAGEGVAEGRGARGEMTKSEYQRLVEFIAPRFDAIGVRFDAIDVRFDAVDKRFDEMDERFDAMDKRFDEMDDRLHRVEILGEETPHQIQIVAERVSETVSNTTFEAFRSEVAAGFQDLREMLRASHLDLGRRVTRLEHGGMEPEAR